MSESTEEQIERLLAEGLDAYGLDEISAAFVAWKKVLELDPENVQAHDYIKSADRRQFPRDDDVTVNRAAPVDEARRLMGEGLHAEALALLSSASVPAPAGLEAHALTALLRGILHREHCERVGDLTQVPVLISETSALTQFDLPPNAGFLVSMFDGATRLEDVISVSGMDAFDALQTLTGLLDAGVVELRP